MKKRYMRVLSMFMAMAIVLGSAIRVPATTTDDSVNASADPAPVVDGGDEDAPNETAPDEEAPKAEETKPEQNESSDQKTPEENPKEPDAANGSQDTGNQNDAEAPKTPEENSGETGTEKKDVSGDISVDDSKDVTGTITVEEDKNDDKVEIKKNDKPYLALGQDLTAEQRATVLSLMGIDAGKLSDYDVVYVNNSEEHQYLNSYVDKSKIGSKSLSSVVIVERKDGNGINISTNNITYCTVGMYKNALATAGIVDADIIVAAPFPISGTAALVGVFKAYTEMTGDEIDEENIDAALHELVVTGKLEAAGSDSDEVENMIAYVKQAVVEHDLSDESEIREAITKGCEKFDITLTEEEMTEITKLMKKISELDLDLDGLLNAAQSIYDKISTADGGFWAKIREIFQTLIAKIKELF